MHWSEDTWEDVVDPPSPSAEATSHLRDDTSDDLYLVQDKPHHNGHVRRGKRLRRKGDASNSSKTLNRSYQDESSETSNTERFDWELLKSDPADVSRNFPTVPHKSDIINGNSIIRSGTDLSEDHTSAGVKSSNQVSFNVGSKIVKSDSKSGIRAKNRLIDGGHSPAVRPMKRVRYDLLENKLSPTDTSQTVTQSLSESHIDTNQQSEKGFKSSANEEPRISQNLTSASVSKLKLQNGRSHRDYTLHEYEKQKVYSRDYLLGRYSIYHKNPHSTEDQDDRLSSDAEETANAVICLVCCVMGVGVIVGLISILIHVSRQHEQKDLVAVAGGHDTYSETVNNIYYHRVAEVIRSASKIDQEGLRQGTRAPVSTGQTAQLQLCGIHPPHLVGNSTFVNLNQTIEADDIIKNNSDMTEGGEWKPATCISRHRVAVIIPYRDRWNHLKLLLHYLIPMLKRQQIHFRIFIVEQYGNDTFNKGRIMNAAFQEALKLFDFHCVTFHDVDLVPEDDRNMYTCTKQPKHMSIGIDKFQYILPYEGLVGGVLMFNTEQFEQVNGYSNMYWGWGAEDDDMTSRILHHGLRVYRPPSNIARYKMVKHDGRKSSEVAVRMKLLRSAAKRSKLEGLNNVQYKLLSTHKERLFTHFIVDIGHP